MIDIKGKNKEELFDAFLEAWPIANVENITIEKYTNLNCDSFTYDLESQMRDLGSIKGGSSFKFGIYQREEKSFKKSCDKLNYANDFAWYGKYGKTKDIAFDNVKKLVNEVIRNAQNGDLQAIEKIDLGPVYKWKIAFHYQNKNNISIIPIFTYKALKETLLISGHYKKNMKMSDMYKMIKDKNNISTLDKAFDLAEKIWSDFKNLNISNEKALIENSKDMTSKRKGNATSNLEYIEYEIKTHKIKYRNRHNQLEKSFEKYLNNIKADNIKKDESYIDFQFNLNNNSYICELKPTEDQTEIKYAVRSAVGQILGYAHNKNYDFKIIVFQDKPKTENLLFLDYLKNNHNIFYLYEISEGIFGGNILKD